MRKAKSELSPMARTQLSKLLFQTPESYRERIHALPSSTSGHEEKKTNPNGGRNEKVFKCSNVSLVVLSIEPPITYREGVFLMNVTANVEPSERKPIFFISCAVEDYFWPLAKDMVTFRAGYYSFVFVLPITFYGIRFPPTCKQDTMKNVESFLEWNSHFIDLAQPNGYEFQEDDPCFWSKVAPYVEELARPVMVELDHHFQETITQSIITHVSLVTKLICHAVYHGSSFSSGIEYLDGRSSSEESKKGSKPIADTFPSVTCVTNVVEAFNNDDPWRLLRMCTTSCSHSTLWNSWMTEKLYRIKAEKLGVRLWRVNKHTMYNIFSYITPLQLEAEMALYEN